MNDKKTLIVVTGATASGKTALAVKVASKIGAEIISADSRQIYKDIPIGTATPTIDEMGGIKHHLVGILELEDYYSAARFSQDAERILKDLWAESDYAVVCGGSMMYVDALCYGIDDLPDISRGTRNYAYGIMATGGIEAVRNRLKELDPIYFDRADLNNHKRMIHAIEVSMEAGRPYSSLLTGQKKERDFRIVKIAIGQSRESLFERINKRVIKMMENGLVEEARRVLEKRHLNSLNTVGYKELFSVFDGKMDMDTAVARIAKNTRVFAKKQLTWMKKYEDLHVVDPERSLEQSLKLIYQ